MTRLTRGILTGVLSGAVAGVLMNQVHAVWSASLLRFGVRNASGGSGDPATQKAAEWIAGPLGPRARQVGGSLMHYAIAAGTGALYGALREAFPVVSAGRGLPYGAAVWLVADEIAVPALGLAPWRVPLTLHARALLAHLVYGLALDSGLRFASRALGPLPAP